jgi:hypothetical protein
VAQEQESREGSGSGAGEQGGEWLRSRRAGRGVAQEQESTLQEWVLIHRDGGAPPLNGGSSTGMGARPH